MENSSILIADEDITNCNLMRNALKDNYTVQSGYQTVQYPTGHKTTPAQP